MGRKKWMILLIVFLAGLAGVHEWVVLRIKGIASDTLRDSSNYPARIQSLRGFLPTGVFWAKNAEFKTTFGDDSVDWKIPDLYLNLNPECFFTNRYSIEDLAARNLTWLVRLRGLRAKLGGDLTVLASSRAAPPDDLPEDTVWSEYLELVTNHPAGEINEVAIDLIRKTSLRVEPFSFRNGEPVLPFDFDLRVCLTDDDGGPVFLARGRQDQLNHHVEADLRAVAVDLPTVERYLETAAVLDPAMGEIGKIARSWIEGGSFSIRLQTSVTEKTAEGQLTIRLLGPRFGQELKRQQLADQSLEPFLEAFEGRTDTIQLGPVSFKEDLTTSKEEAWDMIQTGLATALIAQAPGAALKTGVGALKSLLGGN
jgi:hypothetical protein